MKKFVSLSVLLVFLFLMAGQFLAYQLLVVQGRTVLTEKIRTGNCKGILRKIKLSREEAALVDGDEISYHDKRYDIVSSERSGNSLTISVVDDEVEESMLQGLAESYDFSCSKNAAGHQSHNSILDNISKEYTCMRLSVFSPGEQQVHISLPIHNSCTPLSGYGPSPSLPPETLG